MPFEFGLISPFIFVLALTLAAFPGVQLIFVSDFERSIFLFAFSFIKPVL